MALTPPTTVTIDHDPAALAAIFDELAATGAGWLNLIPELPDNTEVPATPNGLAIFSRRGPVVPLATWTVPTTTKKGTAPGEVGIMHGTSQKAQEYLAGTVGVVPDGWRVLADHPKKGLVAMAAPGASTVDIATWVLDALNVLCLPPHTGRFHVARYEG